MPEPTLASLPKVSRGKTQAERQRLSNALQQGFAEKTRGYAERIAAGTISIPQWQNFMIRAVQKHSIEQAALGGIDYVDRPGLDTAIKRETAYLSRFADQLAIARVKGNPMSAGQIANRSSLYSRLGKQVFQGGTEARVGDEPGYVWQYISQDDGGTCSACLASEGFYLAAEGPMPGSVCFGAGRCRCRRERVYNVEEANRLVNQEGAALSTPVSPTARRTPEQIFADKIQFIDYTEQKRFELINRLAEINHNVRDAAAEMRRAKREKSPERFSRFQTLKEQYESERDTFLKQVEDASEYIVKLRDEAEEYYRAKLAPATPTPAITPQPTVTLPPGAAPLPPGTTIEDAADFLWIKAHDLREKARLVYKDINLIKIDLNYWESELDRFIRGVPRSNANWNQSDVELFIRTEKAKLAEAVKNYQPLDDEYQQAQQKAILWESYVPAKQLEGTQVRQRLLQAVADREAELIAVKDQWSVNYKELQRESRELRNIRNFVTDLEELKQSIETADQFSAKSFIVSTYNPDTKQISRVEREITVSDRDRIKRLNENIAGLERRQKLVDSLYDLDKDLSATKTRLELDATSEWRERFIYQKTPSTSSVRINPSITDPEFRGWLDEGVEGFRRVIGQGHAIDGREVPLSQEQGRAYFTATTGVHIDRQQWLSGVNDTRSVTVHELTHWLNKTDPTIARLVYAKYKERTGSEPTKSLAALTGNSYGANEVTRIDKFTEEYFGKDYYSERGYDEQFRDLEQMSSNELLTMAVQYLYGDPVKLAREDPDLFDWTIDLLRKRL